MWGSSFNETGFGSKQKNRRLHLLAVHCTTSRLPCSRLVLALPAPVRLPKLAWNARVGIESLLPFRDTNMSLSRRGLTSPFWPSLTECLVMQEKHTK